MRRAPHRISAIALGALLALPVALPAQNDNKPNWQRPNLKEATSGSEQRQSQRERREADRKKRDDEAAKAKDAAKPKEGEDKKEEKKAAAPAGKQTKTNAPAAKSEGGDAKPPAAKVETAEFAVRARPEQAMLRLTGKDDINATDVDAIEGSEFVTDVRLTNPSSKAIDRVRLVIDYNPAYAEPVSINDSAIMPNFSGTPTARVDRSLGQIYYDVELATPIIDLKTPVIFINWNALKPVSFTSIRFGRTRDGEFSELFEKGEKVLGASYDDGDGTVSLGLTVLPADPAEALVMQEDPNLYLGSDERVGGVLLAIRPPEKAPRVGEPFSMDVVFDNTTFSQLDGVSMMIQYDPSVLTILDADHDNWITLGTNIHDGSARERFPWDYHMANAVHQSRGLIEYRVGSSYPDDFVGIGGVVATIHAVATKPAAATSVRFVFARTASQRTTTVSYLGQDVLGDTRVRNDGVKGAVFPVFAAPSTAAAEPAAPTPGAM